MCLHYIVWNQIRVEPIVREADSSDNSPALINDIGICGVWLPQVEALMDVRVVDTDAQSYLDHSRREVLNFAESEKRRKYACQHARSKEHNLTLFAFLLIVCGEKKLSDL